MAPSARSSCRATMAGERRSAGIGTVWTVERVAFVTGAASGIGRAIAKRLSSEGLSVIAVDIDGEGAQSLVREVTSFEGRASSVAADVADMAQVEAAASHAIENHGHVDVLVNAAGFDVPVTFLDSEPGSWERLIGVNLGGVLNCTYVVGRQITERSRATGFGRIVSIASDAGRVGSLGEAVYSAAKGGIIAFTKSMARELARDNVTVNAICPGPADTPMTERFRQVELGDKLIERMVRATPLRRLVQPSEVAAAVAYFAGEDAGFVTGQVMSVSGGLTMSG